LAPRHTSPAGQWSKDRGQVAEPQLGFSLAPGKMQMIDRISRGKTKDN